MSVYLRIEVSDEAKDAFSELFLFSRPIPQIPDPEWVDPGDGTPHPMVDEFTVKGWFETCLRKFALMTCSRGLEIKKLSNGEPVVIEDLVERVE